MPPKAELRGGTVRVPCSARDVLGRRDPGVLPNEGRKMECGTGLSLSVPLHGSVPVREWKPYKGK